MTEEEKRQGLAEIAGWKRIRANIGDSHESVECWQMPNGRITDLWRTPELTMDWVFEVQNVPKTYIQELVYRDHVLQGMGIPEDCYTGYTLTDMERLLYAGLLVRVNGLLKTFGKWKD